MLTLAIDPGSTTGWALYDGERLILWGQTQWDYFCDHVYEGVFGDLDRVVLESFVITGKTHQLGQEGIHDTLNCIGFITWFCLRNEIQLVTQKPAERKPISDTVLKQIGWYKQGKHARDAIRHLAMLLTKEGKLTWRRPT